MKRWGGDEQPTYPGLARIAAVARRRWRVVLAATLAGAALATAVGGSGEARYRASAKLLVGPIGAEYSLVRAAGRQAETYVELAKSEPVLQAARARFRPPSSVSELRAAVSVDADDVSRLLTITAEAGSARGAAATANALVAALTSRTRADGPQSARKLTVLLPARSPSSPVGRRSKLLVVIAALAGLLGSVTLLAVIDLGGRPEYAEAKAAGVGGGPT